jgi:hypothetical protein
MALWRCRKCGCTFAVGLPYCPQCTGTDVEEDAPVAKISKHGGPSDQSVAQPVVAGAGEADGGGEVVEAPHRPKPSAEAAPEAKKATPAKKAPAAKKA